MIHLLAMVGMVVKMVLVDDHLKYVVFIPEWFFNI
jgi:hypothetical protein